MTNNITIIDNHNYYSDGDGLQGNVRYQPPPKKKRLASRQIQKTFGRWDSQKTYYIELEETLSNFNNYLKKNNLDYGTDM